MKPDVLLPENLAVTPPAVEDAVELLPDVEYDVVLSVPSPTRFTVRGRIIEVRRGRQDLTLSDAEIANLMPESEDGATGLV